MLSKKFDLSLVFLLLLLPSLEGTHSEKNGKKKEEKVFFKTEERRCHHATSVPLVYSACVHCIVTVYSRLRL